MTKLAARCHVCNKPINNVLVMCQDCSDRHALGLKEAEEVRTFDREIGVPSRVIESQYRHS